jgi:hypothetical protein
MKFYINSSKASTICKINRYGNIVDETIYLWKKLDKLHYYECEKKSKEKGNFNETIEHKFETFKKDLDLQKTICEKVHTKADIENVKKDMEELIDNNKNLSVDEKKEFKKRIESNIRCEYGTKNEDKVVERNNFKDNNLKAHFLSHKFKHNKKEHIFTFVGKIDGKTEDGKLIEIKNRVKGFMFKIPKYEICQVHIYMMMMKVKECELVENFGNDQKITNIKFDKDFWNNEVVSIVENYCKNFINFLGDKNECIKFLGMNDKQKLRFVNDYFYRINLSSKNVNTLEQFGFI